MNNYRATYSPDDNKLRLYADARLDAETYQRVKAAGFKWAPMQKLFVAPMWTPDREDLLLELADEIEDEDTSLVERAEERAGRFDEYSDNRAKDAESARRGVAAIADHIPLGQPILVGHHSERHARKDAERIENGMHRAVTMWKQSEYWTQRAKGALRHAQYKERPDVRARRIKGLEADKRKQEKHINLNRAEAKLWAQLDDPYKDGRPCDDELRRNRALFIANHSHTYLPDGDPRGWSVWSALDKQKMTPAEARDYCLAQLDSSLPRHRRWLEHYDNRLAYERAMLEDAGGTVTDRTGPEAGGGCRCWASPRGGWSWIKKVNRISVTVEDNWGNGGRNFTRTIPFDKLSAVMTKAQVEAKRAAGELIESDDKTGFFILADKPTQTVNPSAHGANIEAGLKHKEKEAAGDKPADPDAFKAMAEQLRNGGVKVAVVPQLFPTPPAIARRMIEKAELAPGMSVLEPSAGTAVLLRELAKYEVEEWPTEPALQVTAVELNPHLYDIARQYAHTFKPGDFLAFTVEELGRFDRIIMNPPFSNGEDVRHIEHARQFLKPGGRIVALCANGPRQGEKLGPIISSWEALPEGSFEEQGTRVNVALLTIDG